MFPSAFSNANYKASLQISLMVMAKFNENPKSSQIYFTLVCRVDAKMGHGNTFVELVLT